MASPNDFKEILEKIDGFRGISITRALANYAETSKATQEAVSLQQDVDALIEYINSGNLPAGHMVATTADSHIPIWADKSSNAADRNVPEHATRIYRPNNQGEYFLDGELATGSSTQLFLGDRIIIIDGEAVIVNLEHQVGITAGQDVDIINLFDDPRKNTLGGPSDKRFESFLGLVESVRGGAQVHHDLSWG